MNYKTGIVETRRGPATSLTLQTNEQNSFTRANLLELESLLKELHADDSVRAVFITSESQKFFSNGVDAQNILKTSQEELAGEMVQIVHFFNYLLTFEKPLLAEVTGYAMGGGAVVALGCDCVVMLDGKGRMSFTEVFFGLPLAGTFIEKIRQKVRPPFVHDVIFGGIYRSGEAMDVGLVNETAPDREALRSRMLGRLEQMLQIPTSAYRGTKRTLNRSIAENVPVYMKILAEGFAEPAVIDNLREAMNALREKRRPHFS